MMLDDDDDLLRRAMAARNSNQFCALWHGDTTAYAGDRSRADLALCRRLAFWTSGDATRVDRLFRQSGLMRTKWDKKHYANGRTYGEATVAKVVSLLSCQGPGHREPFSQSWLNSKKGQDIVNRLIGLPVERTRGSSV